MKRVYAKCWYSGYYRFISFSNSQVFQGAAEVLSEHIPNFELTRTTISKMKQFDFPDRCETPFWTKLVEAAKCNCFSEVNDFLTFANTIKEAATRERP